MLQIGKASLPDDINRVASTNLKGPCVLQLVAADDVSQPAKGVASGNSSHRSGFFAGAPALLLWCWRQCTGTYQKCYEPVKISTLLYLLPRAICNKSRLK